MTTNVAEKPINDLTTMLMPIYRVLPVGLCYLDTQLRFVSINDWLANINGISAEGHLGRTLQDLIPEVAKGVEDQYRQVIETGEPIIRGIVEAETPAEPGIIADAKKTRLPLLQKRGAEFQKTAIRILGMSPKAVAVARKAIFGK